MKIALSCCPCWGIIWPPYNLAILNSILKYNNHESKIFDFNVSLYNKLKNNDIDFWEFSNEFHWRFKEWFYKSIYHLIDKYIDEYVDEIINYNPDCVGFTIYDNNVHTVKIVIERIREKNPQIKIIVGGPACRFLEPIHINYPDCIVVGEGEESIIEAIKFEKKIIECKKPINLNDYPIPDYGDLDLSLYKSKHEISLEFSRGCNAKCSFCNETHFWKYKHKSAEKILEEIKENIRKYKISGIRFNDSLINGNMKEFKKFIDLLHKENLNLHWSSYSRVNKLLNYELLKKIKETGNNEISYGVESGSQKVLNDMRKGIKIKTIEANLYDGYRAGINNHLNWIIGFVTETNFEALESLTFLYNNKDYIYGISVGFTHQLTPGSYIQKNPKLFGVDNKYLWDRFSTKNKRNNILIRFIRMKLTNILLDYFNINNSNLHKYINSQYEIETFNSSKVNRIEYEECINFEYYIKNDFQSILYPEYISFMWLFYKIFGSIKLKFKFNYKEDVAEFSDDLVIPYNANISCDVSDNGKWKMEINHISTTVEIFNETKHLTGDFKNDNI